MTEDFNSADLEMVIYLLDTCDEEMSGASVTTSFPALKPGDSTYEAIRKLGKLPTSLRAAWNDLAGKAGESRKKKPDIARCQRLRDEVVAGLRKWKLELFGDGVPFTEKQKTIWRALYHQAKGIEQLANACGVATSALYKRGGINELRERGLVKHEKQIGFYRPDAPPSG